MKRWLCWLGVVAAIAAEAQTPEIPKGAHVLLRMVNSVSTKTAQPGDFVYLRTATPIATGGRIAVPADSYVQGVVVRSKRAGKVSGRAELSIRLETLTLASGQVVKFTPKIASVDAGETGQRVSPEGDIHQASGKGQDAGQVAILAGSGAAIGALADQSVKGASIGAGIGTAVGLAQVLLTRGKEVALTQGSTIDVAFDRAVTLE